MNEINIRNGIMDKAYKGEKLTKEEREWLCTHSLYNFRLGYPFYNICVESLAPKTTYRIKVYIDSLNFDNRITPQFFVRDNKSYISCSGDVLDYYGNVCSGNKIKGLAWNSLSKNETITFDLYSDNGLVSIAYECHYYDALAKLHKRESSSTGNSNFAIKRNVINDNTIQYICKDPTSDDVDAMFFTVSVERIGDK